MNQATGDKSCIYQFGRFVLDPTERTLFADGQPVHLTDKVFDTLLLLVENNGRLLTKDEMMSSLWNESFVEEGNLAKNISRLRKILRTDDIELIETLPKHGYRFLAEVKEIDGQVNFLVHRNLRGKITYTVEDNLPTPTSAVQIPPTRSFPQAISSRQKTLLLALGILLGAIISTVAIYLWKRERPVRLDPFAAIRLTDDPKEEQHPAWTSDGRIRFLRTGSDKQTQSLVMNADGTNQTEVRDFNGFDYGVWSPDGTKVIFAMHGDKTAFHLANADGSNQITLPFIGGNFDWSPDSKKIVYQKTGDLQKTDIFIYSLDTGKTENITNDLAFDADPSFSPDGKKIAFASLRDGNAEIYLMNSDGSAVQRLTNHPAWDTHPVFSPDGTQIAFPSDRDNENSNLYLMRTDGSDIRRLTDWQANETVDPGCWSPDGTRIAFTSDRNGNNDIFVINAETYRPRIVVADETSDLQFPSFSPDGTIVYQAEMSDKTGELRVFDPQTRQTNVLIKTENSDLAPVFSPDGEWIAFQNRIKGNTEICLIKKDGTNLTNLTQNSARDVTPSFSPDGKQIAFASNRDGNFGNYELYVMNTDGSNQHRVHSSNAMSSHTSWSPDGKLIVFANDKEDGRTGNFEIFTVEPETGNKKRLTIRRRADTQPVFSPDGKRIAFTSNIDGNWEIYLMNGDGTGLLRLTRNLSDDATPQFSRDGKGIIFSSDRVRRFALYEIRISE